MQLLSIAIAWLIAAITLVLLRDRKMSRRFALLILASCTAGAGTVQFAVCWMQQASERYSAALLVGVSSSRLQDDIEFVETWFIDENGNGIAKEPMIDYSYSLKNKADDIGITIHSVNENNFIRTYYAVWAGDLAFQEDQLERQAKASVTTDDPKVRGSNVMVYLECVKRTKFFLDRLASEIRSRPPEMYYFFWRASRT